MYERTDKGRASLLNEKQRAKFTGHTSGLKYTKNQNRLFKAILAGDNDFDSLMKKALSFFLSFSLFSKYLGPLL